MHKNNKMPCSSRFTRGALALNLAASAAQAAEP
jgi:hypothetical protein